MARTEEETACLYRIEMLGGFRLFRSGSLIRHIQPHRPGALLAFLAYHADRMHTREELVEVLWPETDPMVGRNRLKQTLSALRDELGSGEDGPDGVLIANRAAMRLNETRVATDVSEFMVARVQAVSLPLVLQRRLAP